jgi:hypothetical protein
VGVWRQTVGSVYVSDFSRREDVFILICFIMRCYTPRTLYVI